MKKYLYLIIYATISCESVYNIYLKNIILSFSQKFFIHSNAHIKKRSTLLYGYQRRKYPFALLIAFFINIKNTPQTQTNKRANSHQNGFPKDIYFGNVGRNVYLASH